MKWLIGSIVFGLMSVVGLFASIGDQNNIFVAIVIFLIFIVCIKKYRDSKNPALIAKKEQSKNERLEKEKLIPGSKARIAELGADICINARHMAGLPINEGADTFLYRCEDKVIFERNETTYELELTKIKDITIKTDVEIQKSYVSSIGGAVGGYELFGTFGAMIFGRAKEKKSQIIEKYLIFSYENTDNIEYISFEVTDIPYATLFENLMDNKKRIRTTVKL